MKFRIAFAVSRTQRKWSLRLWKWNIWRSDSDIEEESVKKDLSKAGFLSFKKKTEESDEQEPEDENENKFLFQALFYPKVESRIWLSVKRLISRIWKFFSVQFENFEIKGTLGDPFYDSIAMGMSGGCYYPDWENENGSWSAKGEIILKIGFFRFIFFTLGFIYEFAAMAFILWRGVRLAKKNPNGENLEGIRKWIFLNSRS